VPPAPSAADGARISPRREPDHIGAGREPRDDHVVTDGEPGHLLPGIRVKGTQRVRVGELGCVEQRAIAHGEPKRTARIDAALVDIGHARQNDGMGVSFALVSIRAWLMERVLMTQSPSGASERCAPERET
jgi:hypothetical protein